MEKKREPLRCRSVAEADSTSWREVAGLNEITDVGSYIVQLKHAAVNNELPLPACDNEHYIVATLIVTESGSAEKLQKHRVIGQTLILSQCNDGQTGIYYRSQAPVDGEQVWSEWNALLSTGQFNEIADGNTSITLDVKDNSVTAQKLSADVRKKVDSPLRPLYIAAGAEYNDSNIDTTRTSPWGESVTHKAGHYYLNGLGDITEEQMMAIYNAGFANGASMASHYEGYTRLRTCLQRNPRYNYPRAIGGYSAIDMNQSFQLCSAIETINITCATIYVKTAVGAFQQCEKLVRIHDILNLGAISKTGLQGIFATCLSLESIRIKAIKVDISFSDSPNLNKESVVYIIQNAAPTAAMTITLHPRAYAHLTNDSDIVAALEAQPLISLVSA